MQERYGFVPPSGLAFGEKPHDRLLVPDFMARLSERVQTSLSGTVVDGALATVYTDNPEVFTWCQGQLGSWPGNAFVKLLSC